MKTCFIRSSLIICVSVVDLVAGCNRVVVTMEHCTKKGGAKVLKECTLPLTGSGVVDMIITELAVFEVHKTRHDDHVSADLVLTELAPDVTVEKLRECTEADFTVSPQLRVMLQ